MNRTNCAKPVTPIAKPRYVTRRSGTDEYPKIMFIACRTSALTVYPDVRSARSAISTSTAVTRVVPQDRATAAVPPLPGAVRAAVDDQDDLVRRGHARQDLVDPLDQRRQRARRSVAGHDERDEHVAAPLSPFRRSATSNDRFRAGLRLLCGFS